MRLLPRLTVPATLGAAALATAVLAAPAAGATTAATRHLPVAGTVNVPSTESTGSGVAISGTAAGAAVYCIEDGGTIFAVNNNGIAIRSSPNGAGTGDPPLTTGRWWNDVFAFNGNDYTCMSQSNSGGQYWVPGTANYDPNYSGWVGANYLNFQGNFTGSGGPLASAAHHPSPGERALPLASISTGAAIGVTTFGSDAVCIDDNGTIFGVNNNGITIRSSPNGPDTGDPPLTEGRWWVDFWGTGSSSVFYTCMSQSDSGSQYWLPGHANDDPSYTGWVGSIYLDYVEVAD
jgi:putative hemolysin